MPAFPLQGGSHDVWGTELRDFFAPHVDLLTSNLLTLNIPGANITSGNNIALKNTFNNANVLMRNTGTTGVSDLTIDTGVLNALVVLNGGNVGIGTASPSARLHVESGMSSTPQFILATASPGAGLGIRTMQPATSGRFNWQFGSQINVNNGFEISPSTVADGTTFTTPAVTILNTGNVGIGTTAPAAKLQVRFGPTANFGVKNSGGQGLLHFYDDAGSSISAQIDAFNLQFKSNGSPTVIINSSGNVGIGTVTPVAALHVRRSASIIPAIFNNGTTPNDNSGIRIVAPISATHFNWMIAAQQNFDGLEFTPSTVVGGTTFSNPALAILQTGNVGIGTTTPSEILSVLGNTTVLSLATPDLPTVTPQGTTGATTYGYRISALSGTGETLASTVGTTTTGNATLTASNFNRITWAAVTGAQKYKVYGRTSGSELLMTTLVASILTFDDIGTITPAGALPTENTTGKVSINSTLPIGKFHIGGDLARPFTQAKSIIAAVAPTAGHGMLRWETGTNAGTLKLVAYSGTSITGVTVVDNVGAGN